MAKYKERIRARTMREKGVSIIVISRKLNVSKSIVSGWCRDIELSGKQIEKLRLNKGISWTTGQRMGAETNKRKKLLAIEEANNWSKKLINKVSKRDKILAAVALYWCKGSKTLNTSSLMFVNSDPQMILFMRDFLINVMGVLSSDIVCGIQINRIHEVRINKVLIFWKKLLKLHHSQIRKPYFVNTKVKKVYENYDSYFGICRLFVRRSRNLKYKMIGLINALREQTMSA